MTDVPAIELRGVEKRFGAKRVLRGVDLAIRRGETFTILGGSGSGKSVCLKHMVGLLRPDAGHVIVEGRDITALREDELIEVRRDVALIFQSAALFDSLSVYENVAYPLREHHDASRAGLFAARQLGAELARQRPLVAAHGQLDHARQLRIAEAVKRN